MENYPAIVYSAVHKAWGAYIPPFKDYRWFKTYTEAVDILKALDENGGTFTINLINK